MSPCAAAEPPPPARWIPPLRLAGCYQMAIDEALLEASLADPAGRPALRLYRWRRPTLSLGHHQRSVPGHWLELAGRGTIDLVRRPSGGRAVLHAGDLTYALVWPAAAARRRQAYDLACAWLCQAFRELDLPLQPGRQAPSRDRSSCFATSTSADLVHPGGAKRIGSAQLWRRGSLLQHGSIQIDPPPDLWVHLFGASPPPLPPLPLHGEALEAHLRRCAERHAPFRVDSAAGASTAWRELPLDRSEWRSVAARLERYRVESGLPVVAADASPSSSPLA